MAQMGMITLYEKSTGEITGSVGTPESNFYFYDTESFGYVVGLFSSEEFFVDTSLDPPAAIQKN